MTGQQWEKLVAVINGRLLEPLPVGFIIDSPWLPGWAGISIIDYFSDDQSWFDANLKAIRQFPDIIFLPGFWAEFAMCTEPPQGHPAVPGHHLPARLLGRIRHVHRALRLRLRVLLGAKRVASPRKDSHQYRRRHLARKA
jgi:hypothetical protein